MTKLGRIFFGISIAGFGMEHFLYAGSVAKIVPPWMRIGTIGAYVAGAALIAMAIGIFLKSRLSATLLGIAFFLCILIFRTPELLANFLQDGIARTRAFEILAMCGGARVLAEARRSDDSPQPDATIVSTIGRCLFAVSLVVFGIDHFQFAPFVAAVIPSWVPGHMFWTYFTGTAFVAAGLSIATKIYGRLAAALLALMFFFWVVLLHGPRVVAQVHNGDEWASAFVALAMCGCGLILAGALPEKR